MLRIVERNALRKVCSSGGTSPRQNKVAPSAWCASRSSAGSGTRWANVRSCSLAPALSAIPPVPHKTPRVRTVLGTAVGSPRPVGRARAPAHRRVPPPGLPGPGG